MDKMRNCHLFKLEKYYHLIGVLILAAVLATVVANMRNPMIILRGGEEMPYRIQNDTVIRQQIILRNTNRITISPLNMSTEESNGNIVFRLLQEGKESIVMYSVNDFPEKWSPKVIQFDYKGFHDGEAYLEITGNNITDFDNIQVLLTGEVNQTLPFKSVTVNGNTYNSKYLVLNYNYFSLKIWAVLYLLFAVTIAIIISTFPRIYPKIQKSPVLVLALLMLIIRYFQQDLIHNQLDGWATTPYLINYHYGFLSKALPGTIYSIFCDYVSMRTLRIIFHMLFFTMAIIVLCFLQYAMNNTNSSKKVAITHLSLLYVISPVFISFYYRQFGRMEEILLIIFIICGVLIIRQRALYIVPFLSVLAVLCHQIYVFTYYPFVEMLFLYQIVILKKRNYILPAVGNIVLPGFITLFIQFWGHINIPFPQFMQLLTTRTDTHIVEAMVSAEYYDTFYENVTTYMLVAYRNFNMFHLIFGLLLLTPVILMIYNFYKILVKQFERISEKVIIVMIGLCPFGSIPMFLTICDYGRVFVMVVTATFLTMLMLCKLEDDRVLYSLVEIDKGISQLWSGYGYIMLCMYIILLGRVDVDVIFREVLSPFKTGVLYFMDALGLR